MMQIYGTKEELDLLKKVFAYTRDNKEKSGLQGNLNAELFDIDKLAKQGIEVEDMARHTSDVNRDRTFNTSLKGYLVYSMRQCDFSRADVNRMIRIIEDNGFDTMTIKEAEVYMNQILEGKRTLDDMNDKPNRILSLEKMEELQTFVK